MTQFPEHTHPIQHYSTCEDWECAEKEKVRERAWQYAECSYGEFKKSDLYKTVESVSYVLEYVTFFMAVAFVSAPLIGYFVAEIIGLVVGSIWAFLSVHFWVHEFKNPPDFDFSRILKTKRTLLSSRSLMMLAFALLNLFVLLKITLNTVIPTNTLLLSFVGVWFAVAMIWWWLKLKISFFLLMCCLVPSVFNLPFFVNYGFGSETQTEYYTYHLHHEKNMLKRMWFRFPSIHKSFYTTFIHLNNEGYQDSYWVRVFYDYEKFSSTKYITYEFKDGALGFKVMKGYKLGKTEHH